MVPYQLIQAVVESERRLALEKEARRDHRLGQPAVAHVALLSPRKDHDSFLANLFGRRRAPQADCPCD
jgi:hypothetical protein